MKFITFQEIKKTFNNLHTKLESKLVELELNLNKSFVNIEQNFILSLMQILICGEKQNQNCKTANLIIKQTSTFSFLQLCSKLAPQPEKT